jgi:uncharacterized protein (DUF2062 family)
MLRKYLRRISPPAAEIKNHWLLGRLGSRLLHPRLWHLNRRSVAGATGIGLFVAFIPVPFQMVFSALGALWLRVNLPLSAALVLITNPLTMGPAYYLCYRTGAWLLGEHHITVGKNFTPTITWLFEQLALIWQPLLVGCLAIATTSAVTGYCLVQILWRGYIIYRRGSLLRALAQH